MHAIEYISDGITALIHQQRQAFFRIVANNLGMLEFLAQAQIFHHPVHHQSKHVPVVIGDHATGTLQQCGFYRLGRKGVFQQNHRHRLAQTLEVSHGRFETAIAKGRPAQHQLPGTALEGTQQVIFA